MYVLYHCTKCHHEWQGVDGDESARHCQECGAEGYILDEGDKADMEVSK